MNRILRIQEENFRRLFGPIRVFWYFQNMPTVVLIHRINNTNYRFSVLSVHISEYSSPYSAESVKVARGYKSTFSHSHSHREMCDTQYRAIKTWKNVVPMTNNQPIGAKSSDICWSDMFKIRDLEDSARTLRSHCCLQFSVAAFCRRVHLVVIRCDKFLLLDLWLSDKTTWRRHRDSYGMRGRQLVYSRAT